MKKTKHLNNFFNSKNIPLIPLENLLIPLENSTHQSPESSSFFAKSTFLLFFDPFTSPIGSIETQTQTQVKMAGKYTRKQIKKQAFCKLIQKTNFAKA